MIILVCALIFAFFAEADEKYTTKYDNVDYEEILGSDRLLKNYVNCLLEKGPCTPDGKELKNVLPDALNTGCSKCSDTQKRAAKKVVRHLVINKPDIWTQLVAKYDPNGVFIEEYQDEWMNAPLD